MKILFIGVFDPTSTNYSQANELELLNNIVIRYEYRLRSEKIGNVQRDNEIIALCEREKPNLVIFSKCNSVHVRVIFECNKIAKTCLWYMDPPGNWNFELEQKVKACSYVCCAKQFAVDLAKKLNQHSYLVVEGFDPIIDKPANIEQDIDVSFIGSLYTSERKDICKKLGIKVISAYGASHAKTVSRSKININFCTGNTESDRVYKIMASGGFLLTTDWEGRCDNFIDKTDLVIFSTHNELQTKIAYYLEHEKERNLIARKGMETVQVYSRASWAKKILAGIEI
jgi:hypothetical protein